MNPLWGTRILHLQNFGLLLPITYKGHGYLLGSLEIVEDIHTVRRIVQLHSIYRSHNVAGLKTELDKCIRIAHRKDPIPAQFTILHHRHGPHYVQQVFRMPDQVAP